MAAVFASEPQVAAAIEPYRGQIAIAALNGPESIVISGDASAVDEVLARLETEGIKSKPLATSHAFHSQRMDPMLDALRQAAAAVAYSKPEIDIVANLTGQAGRRAYVCRPVLLESPRPLAGAVCPEHAGAGRSGLRDLSGDRSQSDAHRHGPALPACRKSTAWLPSLRPGRDDWQSMLDSLGQLYVRGAKIDWAGFDRHYPAAQGCASHLSLPAQALLVRFGSRTHRRQALPVPRPTAMRCIRCSAAAWSPPCGSRSSSRRCRCIGRRRWPITRSRAR